ncbi:MAG: hypothetical protein CMB48_00155 [Euryarchaeota archaeon]|nr:hypothetical protein [Euryarchaeota archaeon]|tara:strand:+ start:1223 stop:1561 length:339 start_codon:yes stop_codon:yes gene_type:complete
MEFEKTQIRYFILVTQILILVVSLYKIIHEPSEKYWVLVIVLSSLIFIFIISMFTTKKTDHNKLFPQLNSETTMTQKSKTINLKSDLNTHKNHESSNENIPDVLEEGWDLPL